MRTVLRTTPSNNPPRAVPTMEPVAMMSTNAMLWRSTAKLVSPATNPDPAAARGHVWSGTCLQ